MNDFSINLDMVNRHYQEPNRNRYESKYFWEELYSLIAAAGFDGIQLPYEPIWQFGGRSGVPMNTYCLQTKYQSATKYKQFLRDAGIDQVSAIHFDANLFARNDQIGFLFGATGHFASQAVDLASELECPVLALSPSPYYGRLLHYYPDLEDRRSEFLEKTDEVILNLADQAKIKGVTLALRAEYWGLYNPRTLALRVSSYNRSNIGLCLNTAHVHLAGESPNAYADANAKHIKHVELSDTQLASTEEFNKSANPAFPNTAATQVFRDVGTGQLNLKEVINNLAQKNYQGSFSLSNHQTRDHNRALLRSRRFVNQLRVQEK